MTTEQLKAARQQVAQLEEEMFADLKAKADLLGLTFVKEEAPMPKARRKRRTKAEIEAAKAQAQT